jgi:hypothetical protein
VIGAIYATLPAGCSTSTVPVVDTTYYVCGNTWFQPSYGANGWITNLMRSFLAKDAQYLP